MGNFIKERNMAEQPSEAARQAVNDLGEQVVPGIREHTPGPWTAVRMLDEDTGELPTPERIGEYVKNCVLKSAKESGTTDFLIVMGERDSEMLDVCHVGNGLTSSANARLIAIVPKMYEFIKDFASNHAPRPRSLDQELKRARDIIAELKKDSGQ